MHNLILVILFAGMSFVGFVSVLQATRGLRAPRMYRDALLVWTETPRADLRADFSSWITINLHRAIAIGLGIGALRVLLTQPLTNMGLLLPQTLSLLGVALIAGAVAMLSFLWGFVTGGLLAELVSGDRQYAVAEAGFLAHGRLFPWNTFSEFSFDPSSGLVYLWSASLRGAVAFSVKPPSTERTEQLLGILQSHLSHQVRSPGVLQRYTGPLLMLPFCAVFALAGVLLCSGPATLALLAMPLLLWLFLGLGSYLIMRAIYRGDGQPAAVASV